MEMCILLEKSFLHLEPNIVSMCQTRTFIENLMVAPRRIKVIIIHLLGTTILFYWHGNLCGSCWDISECCLCGWKSKKKKRTDMEMGKGCIGVKYPLQWFTVASVYRTRCVGVGETCMDMEWVSVNASSCGSGWKSSWILLRWSENELIAYTWQSHQPLHPQADLRGPSLRTLARRAKM